MRALNFVEYTRYTIVLFWVGRASSISLLHTLLHNFQHCYKLTDWIASHFGNKSYKSAFNCRTFHSSLFDLLNRGLVKLNKHEIPTINTHRINQCAFSPYNAVKSIIIQTLHKNKEQTSNWLTNDINTVGKSSWWTVLAYEKGEF